MCEIKEDKCSILEVRHWLAINVMIDPKDWMSLRSGLCAVKFFNIEVGSPFVYGPVFVHKDVVI